MIWGPVFSRTLSHLQLLPLCLHTSHSFWCVDLSLIMPGRILHVSCLPEVGHQILNYSWTWMWSNGTSSFRHFVKSWGDRPPWLASEVRTVQDLNMQNVCSASAQFPIWIKFIVAHPVVFREWMLISTETSHVWSHQETQLTLLVLWELRLIAGGE